MIKTNLRRKMTKDRKTWKVETSGIEGSMII